MKSIFYNLINLIRLNQPIGIILVYLPCLSSIALVSKINNIPKENIFYISFWFLIGAIIVRSAGCIINDIFDKKFDSKVIRTKNRPLASGAITQKTAIILFAILGILSLLILIKFNFKTIISGLIAGAMIMLYPLMKRYTYFPQLFLGITFNFGIILASFALKNEIFFSIIILYIAHILWTFLYDTLYAFQDLKDDLKIGVKSSAIYIYKLKNKILLYKIATVIFLLLLIIGINEEFLIFYFIIIVIFYLSLLYGLWQCDLKNSLNCLQFFKLNTLLGALIFIAITVG
jgi:4-hydroxybenzoate polyprenyltransferase